ncbi:M48 family metallopeptidase [Cellulomonas sp. PS-H5]|uniref:M48 family metallopeptidase n=1 Tax=Cellulomonas sp. PS-H5 TaxID=2820400 RepID=UPI001C4EB9E6|nr:M48 family metallopeptidase [Cellulomonas sp. PS-H5]MBW0255339.1 M48 family metalloprotease [Cellulomonas sp. PS-H5]
MITTLRAALSLVMLAGFYVVAVGLAVLLGWLSVLAFSTDHVRGAGYLAIFALVLVFGIVSALWKVARAKAAPPHGVEVPPQSAPELWTVVRELSAAAHTRAPDEIRLVPEVNAAVSEEARLLGLVGGRRRMYLGVPLVQGLDVAMLRSVLAHELGHYSRNHTRLGPLAYRGRAVVMATVQATAGSVVGWLLMGYAWLYMLVSAAVSRRQELEADEISVAVAGRAVAQQALREVEVVSAAWAHYTGVYVAPAFEVGLAPAAPAFFGGFDALLAARSDELADLRRQDPDATQSRWDSHPSHAARIAAMDRMPDVHRARDTRRATLLVPGFSDAAAMVAEGSLRFEDRPRLDWPALGAAATTRNRQRLADGVYRAAARLAGLPRATLATVLGLVAQGRGPELALELGLAPSAPDPAGPLPGAGPVGTPSAPVPAGAPAAPGPVGTPAAQPTPGTDADDAGTLVDALEVVVRSAAVQAGIARWEQPWLGGPRLVDAAGEAIDPRPLAVLAADPRTVADARAHLTALRVDVDRAGQESAQADALGASLLAGVASVSVDGARHDVLVLDEGLVLVPAPRRGSGRKRLAALVEGASVGELAARYRYLPFEEVATAKVRGKVPLRATLVLKRGGTVRLKGRYGADKLADNSEAVLAAAVLSLRRTPAKTRARA